MKEQRLIDANVIRDEVLNDNTYDNDTVNYYLGVIDAAPTVEPKRGEWVGKHKATCSVCGAINGLAYVGIYKNYCPNCGADMRKEVDQ